MCLEWAPSHVHRMMSSPVTWLGGLEREILGPREVKMGGGEKVVVILKDGCEWCFLRLESSSDKCVYRYTGASYTTTEPHGRLSASYFWYRSARSHQLYSFQIEHTCSFEPRCHTAICGVEGFTIR
jgi:hypothetical protein